MKFAGHADFKTTHQFYLDVTDDLKQRAKRVVSKDLCKKLVQIGANGVLEKGLPSTTIVSPCLKTTYEWAGGGIEPPTHGFSVRC